MVRPARRRTARAVVLGTCLLGIVALLGGIVRQGWVTNAQTTDVVHAEAFGVGMLHPMTTVLAQLVAAQSAAVRGETVDAGALRKALRAVADENEEQRNRLQTGQRVTDLTSKIEDALRQGETGRAAYDTYNGLVTLALDLIRRIGEQSHLVNDPGLDSFYLMDAAIIRLPDAVVLAGRAADLVALAGGKALEGEDAMKAAVARFGVSDSAEHVSAGLTLSVDFTERKVLGSNIAERLDTFKAAADAFAPPTMLVDLATTVDAAALAANARRVSSAASPLAHLLLGELQALLDQRAQTLANSLRFLLGGAFIMLLLGAAVAGFTLLRAAAPSVPTAHPDGLTISSVRDLLGPDELASVGSPPGRVRARETGDAR